MANGGDIQIDKNASWIGVLIAAMAAVMVFTQIASDNAQSDALEKTVEASNIWAFFQAKTVRKTILETAAEELELATAENPSEKSAAIKETVAKWRATAARYESEPETNEGRKELMARARALEAERRQRAAQNDIYDYSTGCLQIGIVLASTAIITSLRWMAYLGGVVGLGGAVLAALAYASPGVLA